MANQIGTTGVCLKSQLDFPAHYLCIVRYQMCVAHSSFATHGDGGTLTGTLKAVPVRVLEWHTRMPRGSGLQAEMELITCRPGGTVHVVGPSLHRFREDTRSVGPGRFAQLAWTGSGPGGPSQATPFREKQPSDTEVDLPAIRQINCTVSESGTLLPG